jgi:hypothetical protein
MILKEIPFCNSREKRVRWLFSLQKRKNAWRGLDGI